MRGPRAWVRWGEPMTEGEERRWARVGWVLYVLAAGLFVAALLVR